MKIKIANTSLFKIKIYKTKPCDFLIFDISKSIYFFKLVSFIKFFKKEKNYYFLTNKVSYFTLFNLKAFFLKLKNLKTTSKLFLKKLYLQGLGYKIIECDQNKYIKLKLGHSHYVTISMFLNSDLRAYTHNNSIVIEGSDKVQVGNFASKIRSFKTPDIYKGKGIWYKKEFKVLKKIKKN